MNTEINANTVIDVYSNEYASLSHDLVLHKAMVQHLQKELNEANELLTRLKEHYESPEENTQPMEG